MPLIAEALNLSRAEIHGIVTFYHDFRQEPAGRHVLKLCRAEACQAVGGDALAARAEEKLGVEMGETTPDGRVTLEAGLLPRALPLLARRHARQACVRPARRGEARRAGDGGASVSARIFISRDSGALCVGAEEVAHAIRKAFEKRGLDVEIVRNGSRGMYWLEPLVEVETAEGRVGYGPVKPAISMSLLDAGLLDGKAHKLGIGLVDDDPVAQAPDAADLRALRHHRSAQPRRLPGAWRL